jgi:hypothetical protein
MTVGTQIIELQDDLSLAAIQRRLARARAQRVLLVLPPGSRLLANPAWLRLLGRQARRQNLKVALVTTNVATRRLARRAGFSVFTRIRRGERARRWRQPSFESPLPLRSGPALAAAPRRIGHNRRGRPQPLVRSEAPDLADRRVSRWANWAEALRLLAFLVVCLSGLAAFFLFVVPVATVTLVAPRHPVEVSIPVVAAVGVEEVDVQAGQVPARVVQTRVEGHGTTVTTGRRDAPADAASGSVLFINRRESEVQVPELTVVGTSTGINVRFQVTQSITVPAGIGATMAAGVEALEPGPDGNVPAFTITRIEGPLSLALRVINDAPMEGGSFQEVGVVTEVDKDRLREELLDDVRQESYLQLGDMLREGELVPPETVETYIMAETFDRFSGEDSDALGLRLELLARGLAVDTHGGEEMAERTLRGRIPDEGQLVDEEVAFDLGPMTVLDETAGKIGFTVTARATTVGVVDGGQVREAIRGRELPEALEVLGRDFELGGEPHLTLRPDWLGRVPWLPFRIHVRVTTR